jgi:hypothetical protein
MGAGLCNLQSRPSTQTWSKQTVASDNPQAASRNPEKARERGVSLFAPNVSFKPNDDDAKARMVEAASDAN